MNFCDAEADYSAAISADPSYAPAYFLRGTVVYRMCRFPEALRDFEKAAELEPENTEYRLGLESCRKEMMEKS